MYLKTNKNFLYKGIYSAKVAREGMKKSLGEPVINKKIIYTINLKKKIL